ncbi:DUF1624 domain-containing protein [Flavobacterium aquicola]|uniref:Putative membrane protein n=1 Tax=Flavobacterium aquicola TaxID=1682742 RepID=A0A3E0DYV3_9FLAO|nr:heparan-alpha-glucosaminide N-acetyltransferase domain-containing protein [Flavobacterium aquicola]REG91131.1 putative membrane protein [Flavobacterium aquicola]
MKRIHSIDIVRGIVMIIMALDHVRDLMHIDSITQSPTDFTTTTPILFFTRWITHLCAPIFVFLAGTSAYMSLKNNNNISHTRRNLFRRGLVLLLLEFTIVNFAIFFDVGFHTLLFEVIASTGFGFIILSLLLKLSSKQLGITGLLIIFLHNLTPLIPFGETSILKVILTPLFSPAAIPLFAGKAFVVGYPPIPWLGIMLVGFACGSYFEKSKEKTEKIFLKIGLGALALFTVMRFINIYGDGLPWTSQRDTVFTFMSFMNISKYPPSLVFCLVTLGIMFLLLAFSERLSDKFKNILSVYGKVPLFYFIIHFYLIHLITLLVLSLQVFHFSQFEFASGTFGRPKGIESGLPLWAVYIIWLAVVTVLYKPCQWYGQYKETHKNWWLKYI